MIGLPQYDKAEGASVATDLQDLEDQLSELHEGGTAKLGSYVEISSKILDGHALRINDSTGKLLSFLFTVPPEYRQLLSDAILHIHECMPGEFKDEDSRAEFFKYLSCHYSWYARYAEKGGNAPKGGHPDKIRKDHKGRLKEYLPEDYDELSIYVEALPLDAASPCYPFGGL
ncbi:hypothetical protein B0H17DRAFT_1324253 [Mycena rosella]|uniref:Uncharacterized protein n=1 Tax=Mycena rosella TaxID=1033263 RepID=A0AAD7MCK6_MYCRO|nr:hypothetical protein B0H17DRAFT_1324253 [Mycena rosella]